MANVREATTQIKELSGKFTLTQKLSIGIAALLVIGAIVYAISSVNGTDWKPLFSNLSSEDAGKITTKLKDEKVAYKVSDDGSTIYVSSDKANEMRIQMASEGLPQSSRVGFELFDQNSFGATEFSEQVKYQRAMEGELERTTKGIVFQGPRG
jgi:flagellar M-ring protein FliF